MPRFLPLGVLLGGLALRWTAILTLGRLFAVDVAIHSGRVVVRAARYRLVRHQSYTALLAAYCARTKRFIPGLIWLAASDLLGFFGFAAGRVVVFGRIGGGFGLVGEHDDVVLLGGLGGVMLGRLALR